MGPRHHLSLCACNTAWLASEILVSMGPNPYLWVLHSKQRLLEPNNKSLWVPALICGSCMQNSEFWTRITILYGSQTSPFVLYMQKQRDFHQNDKCIWVPALICGFSMQNSEFWTGIKSMSHRCNLSFCASNQSDLHQNDKFIMVPALISCKTATLRPDLQVCMGPRPHLWVWAHITACLAQE